MADLLVLEPGHGLLTANLFLPKEHVIEEAVRAQLTFGEGDSEVVLVRDHPQHLEVPRNAFTPEQLRQLEIPVNDHRPTAYRPIKLAPKQEFQLREGQEPAMDALVAHSEDGILNLATGKGKTVLAWFWAAMRGGPILFVAPQKAHLANALIELETFFDFEGTVGWMTDGKFEWERDIVMCTVQTLAGHAKKAKFPSEFHHYFATAIYDEAHHMSAGFFVKAADVVQGQRLGLTASRRRTDETQGIFLAHLGPVIYEDVEPDLIPTVVPVRLDTELTAAEADDCVDRGGNVHLGMTYGVLGQNAFRNRRIIREIQADLDDGRTIYVISHSPDHVRELHSHFPFGGIITAKMKHQERLVQLNKAQVTFTTYGIGAESYNRKDLDCIHLCTPPGARDGVAIQFDQCVGRTLRALPGKRTPVAKIYWDEKIGILNGLVWSLIHHSHGRGWPVEGMANSKSKRRRRLK